jgi:diguanylate cyclase (GGDEF)-like protein/PAS domain S-box-containing protein
MLATGTLAPRPPAAFRPLAGGARIFGPRRTAAGPQAAAGVAAWPVIRTAPAGGARSGEGIVEMDAEGRITYVSLAAQRLLGWREAELLGRSLLTLTGVSSGRALSHGSMLLGAVRQGRRLGIGDVELVCKDRTRLPVACTIAPRLADGMVGGAAFTFIDASVERAQSAALHDALTGLPGAALLADRLQQAVRHANRAMQPLALLVLDLAGFRRLNSRLGHQAGDQLLQAAARRLSGVVRPSDTVARLGGDAFAVLLPDSDAAGASALATTLLAALAAPVVVAGATIVLAAQVGVASYPREAAATLLSRAEAALAEARRSGEPVAVAGAAGEREPALVG